jgi:glutamate formiminotransferase/formiminotetrahydrofolate cyclodeaminase
MTLIKAMADIGQETSISDAGVGALCARTAVLGAGLNVRINSADLKDESARAAYLAEADELEAKVQVLEDEVLEIARGKM